jgi:hypothetical protein
MKEAATLSAGDAAGVIEVLAERILSEADLSGERFKRFDGGASTELRFCFCSKRWPTLLPPACEVALYLQNVGQRTSL